MLAKLREPVSGLTHLFGALLSVVGTIILIVLAAKKGTPWHIVTFSIFGASLILLYTASAIYHLVCASDKTIRILRKIDHMMIYVLIAGTYTPVCLVPLRGPFGWSLFIGVWSLAITGIVLKIVWFDAPRWLYTLFYLGLSWIIVFAMFPLAKQVPAMGIVWLMIGGAAYTIGAVIYGTKWPKINSKVFGFHEIFHLFVLAGSFSHFWFVANYLL